MQIELLDTFLDLIETRSFHRTAERLHITQSTVSGRVMALETAVGARLFTRSRAGTQLSTEGLKFESHARALRHAWTEARRAIEPSPTAITLRIGIQNDLAAGQSDAERQAELDRRCEEARAVQLAPIRADLYKECVAKKQGDEAFCRLLLLGRVKP